MSPPQGARCKMAKWWVLWWVGHSNHPELTPFYCRMHRFGPTICACAPRIIAARVAQITNMHKSSSIRRKHGSIVTSRGVKNLCKLKNVNTGGPGGLCWDRSFCTDLAPSVARMAQSVHFGPGNNWVSSPACRSRVVAIHIARGLGC